MILGKKKVFSFFQRHSSYHKPDKILIIVIAALLVFGLLSLSSASSVIAYARFTDTYHYVKAQFLRILLGLASLLIFSRIDYHFWRRWAFGFLLASIILLSIVFIPGLLVSYGKARSWIDIFGFRLQPSEFVKISFLLYLAAWLESRKQKLSDVHQGIGPFVVILGIIAFLMYKQPDLGTLSIIALTSLIVYFVGGGKIWHLTLIIIFSLLSLSLLIQTKPYQLNRFKCLINPEMDTKKVCYQVNQSLIAVGSGGILGRGWGESRQKYLYLPEVISDSIFAVIAEEIGFIFSGLLVLGYAVFFYRGYIIAKYAPDDFGRNLAVGIVSWITLQAIINIGGIINLLPMTGVPLPFISYGGSAILSSLTAVGILINISRQTKLPAGRMKR